MVAIRRVVENRDRVMMLEALRRATQAGNYLGNRFSKIYWGETVTLRWCGSMTARAVGITRGWWIRTIRISPTACRESLGE